MSIVMDADNVDAGAPEKVVPFYPDMDKYYCRVCKRNGVKLWREYQSMMCVPTCLLHFEDSDRAKVEKGECPAWWVRAIPTRTSDGSDFTSLWSIDQGQWDWFQALPDS